MPVVAVASRPRAELVPPMLLRQTLLYLPAQILVPLSQMAAAFLWTFWLGPEAMGTYAIVWSVQELIYLGALSWWSIYCLRYAGALRHEGRSQALDSTEMAVQVWSAVVQTVAALVAVWALVPERAGVGMVFATLSFTLTRNVSTHFATRARAQLEAIPYSLNLVIGSVAGLVLGFLALEYVEASPEALLFAYALAQCLGFAISWPFSRVALRLPALDPVIMAASWRFGWPLMLSGLLSWAGNHAIRFVVEFDAGRAAVGLMTVGWWMGLRLATFVGLLMMGAAFNVAVERLRTGGPAEALRQLATNAALLLGILVPATVGVWLLGGQLVTFLVADVYQQTTAAILPVAVAAGAARVFREHGTDPTFLVFERPVFPPACSAIDAVATIILCWIGLRWGGVIGAAWGCFIAAALAAGISTLFAMTRLGYYIRFADLWRIAAATAAMALPLLWLPSGMSFLGLAAAAAGGALIYGAVLGGLYPMAAQRYLRWARARIGR